MKTSTQVSRQGLFQITLMLETISKRYIEKCSSLQQTPDPLGIGHENTDHFYRSLVAIIITVSSNPSLKRQSLIATTGHDAYK